MPEGFERQLTERADFHDFVNQFDSVAVWSGGEDGFDYMSPGFETIFGRSVEAVMDDMAVVIEGVHPDDRDRVAQVMSGHDTRVLDGESIQIEHRIVRPDGELRWVEARIFPLHDSDGEVCEVVGVTIDITDRKRTELTLERQNERLDRFAKVLSHDLYNPLLTANGYLDLLADEISHEHLDAIEQSLIRIEEIIADALTLTRVENTAETTESVDLEMQARTAWLMVGDESGTLEVTDLGTIEADASLVGQLFENVFRNAVEHGGHGVTIRVGPLHEESGFYIADDGPGIPDAERGRVFEMGYSTSETGTGLGLVIVQDIVDAHGWDLRLTDSGAGGVRLEVTGVNSSG